LSRKPEIDWGGKTHFVAVAAIQMRRILVDHARKRNAQKNGGEWGRITLDKTVALATQRSVDVLALDEALLRLRKMDPRQCTVVELRLFGGLSDVELAEHLDVSERTVREDWRVAKAWLAQALRRKP
jgi:RNA polymerase sigma factor (TIGR02999 family)